MTLIKHELKQNRTLFWVWTLVLCSFLVVVVAVFPEMAKQMESFSIVLKNMGRFSKIFGMEIIDFTSFIDFMSLETNYSLGIGGGLLAAILGISALSKEEAQKTADFLYSHPITRKEVFLSKLAALIIQLIIFSILTGLTIYFTSLMMGIEYDVSRLALLLGAYLILHLQIAIMSFSISALLRKPGIGLALGLVIGFMLINILKNISDRLDFLKYLTPFAYADGLTLALKASIPKGPLLVSWIVTLILFVGAYFYYMRKDIYG